MGRRPNIEMQAVIDAIAADIASLPKRDILTTTANDIAREYGIQVNTACDILRDLGYDYDGAFWYRVEDD